MARRIVLHSDDQPASREDLTVDYRGALNPQQYAAATARGGPVLVVAGAGTGKTTLLIRRLARRFGFLDHPGTRKVHVSPVPLLGGVAIYAAVLGRA